MALPFGPKHLLVFALQRDLPVGIAFWMVNFWASLFSAAYCWIVAPVVAEPPAMSIALPVVDIGARL